jgi:hypothetical protein
LREGKRESGDGSSSKKSTTNKGSTCSIFGPKKEFISTYAPPLHLFSVRVVDPTIISIGSKRYVINSEEIIPSDEVDFKEHIQDWISGHSLTNSGQLEQRSSLVIDNVPLDPFSITPLPQRDSVENLRNYDALVPPLEGILSLAPSAQQFGETETITPKHGKPNSVTLKYRTSVLVPTERVSLQDQQPKRGRFGLIAVAVLSAAVTACGLGSYFVSTSNQEPMAQVSPPEKETPPKEKPFSEYGPEQTKPITYNSKTGDITITIDDDIEGGVSSYVNAILNNPDMSRLAHATYNKQVEEVEGGSIKDLGKLLERTAITIAENKTAVRKIGDITDGRYNIVEDGDKLVISPYYQEPSAELALKLFPEKERVIQVAQSKTIDLGQPTLEQVAGVAPPPPLEVAKTEPKSEAGCGKGLYDTGKLFGEFIQAKERGDLKSQRCLSDLIVLRYIVRGDRIPLEDIMRNQEAALAVAGLSMTSERTINRETAKGYFRAEGIAYNEDEQTQLNARRAAKLLSGAFKRSEIKKTAREMQTEMSQGDSMSAYLLPTDNHFVYTRVIEETIQRYGNNQEAILPALQRVDDALMVYNKLEQARANGTFTTWKQFHKELNPNWSYSKTRSLAKKGEGYQREVDLTERIAQTASRIPRVPGLENVLDVPLPGNTYILNAA